VDSRDVDAIEDTNIALQRENAELRAELGRAVSLLATLRKRYSAHGQSWAAFYETSDAVDDLIDKWLPKQEATDD
jgi:hypothetical protein